jgi:hypothetical protein
VKPLGRWLQCGQRSGRSVAIENKVENEVKQNINRLEKT